MLKSGSGVSVLNYFSKKCNQKLFIDGLRMFLISQLGNELEDALEKNTLISLVIS